MKIKIITIVILMVSALGIMLGINYSYHVKEEIEDNQDTNIENNMFAYFVFDDTQNDYIKSNSVPIGNYKINEELTYCEANSTIDDYDSTEGIIYYKLNSADKCYIYFDEDTDETEWDDIVVK